jgi:two-component system, sensor histidine kinase and response regulator
MPKILVIEDENLIRESIVDVLEEEGYQCIQAENGHSGIVSAKKYLPDIILCDIKMPEINGHQVLAALREEPSTSTIPFVFISALVDKKDFRTGMELGADDYITKPFTNEELINSVKMRLAKNDEIKARLNELKKNIAQSLPHELRTPLISILGYAQLLMDRHKEIYGDQIYEFAKTIHESGLRLHRLIQNFIIYSRLELLGLSSKTGSNKKVQISSITKPFVKSILENIASRYKRLDDLETDIKDTTVKMSMEDIAVITEEIVDNAFKFSNSNTKVSVNIYNDNDNFIMTVSDSGRGMNTEQITQIGAYVQFERGKYEQQGSGLGLTISKKMVELHGGTFNIKSVYGKKTVVITTIPSK